VSERRYSIPLPFGDDVPFSKGLLARALVVTGLDPERAYLIARRADSDLAERGAVSLDLDRLSELAATVIGDEEAARTVRRLRRLDALQRGAANDGDDKNELHRFPPRSHGSG